MSSHAALSVLLRLEVVYPTLISISDISFMIVIAFSLWSYITESRCRAQPTTCRKLAVASGYSVLNGIGIGALVWWVYPNEEPILLINEWLVCGKGLTVVYLWAAVVLLRCATVLADQLLARAGLATLAVDRHCNENAAH